MNDHEKSRDQLLEELQLLRKRLAHGDKVSTAASPLPPPQDFIQLVLDTDPNLIFVKDHAGRFVLVNQAMADLYGTTCQKLIGEQESRALPLPREYEEYRRVEEEVLRTGRTIVVEESNTRHDGQVRWFHTIKTPLHLPGGVTCVLGIATDITDRKHMEEALRASEERFRQLVESLRQSNEALQALIRAAPVAIYALNPAGLVQSWNPAAERMFGWTEAEAVGRPPQMASAAQADEVRLLRERVLRGEAFSGVEACRFRKDGSRIDVSLSASPIRDAAGQVCGIMAVVADVSERKQLEEKLRQSQKMEAVGRLAGGIAHDFNNLLTIVTGYSSILLERLSPGQELYDPLRQIRKASDRAASLVQQLLAFSRRQMLAPVSLDLSQVVSEMARMLRPLLGKDIELIIRFEPDLGRVKADPSQIEQVLINLAVNARDAMPTGGQLAITGRNLTLDDELARPWPEAQAGAYVELVVSDTGCGMDEQTQALIFEPFFTTKEIGKGTGLGLAMVYGIVKQSGGHVEVVSEPGRGTTFRIYLPRIDEPAESRDSKSGSFQIPSGNETVMVVEDEAAVLALARRVLQTSGYQVLEAADGPEAIRLAESHTGPLHLLVTDVVMPRMSGKKLADTLQASRPTLKVLYVSGYAGDALGHHGLAGEASVLRKPFTPGGLARKVREVLGAMPASGSEQTLVGDAS